jgi:3-deoxy-D-manno-octulosonate 8-phosphate phosphatase (KDO 8-P phosphatase)
MSDVKALKEIKLLIMDVDGVLTDTRIFLDSNGEWKRFYSIRDGVGIKEVQKRGLKTAIITGSKALDIRERAKMLAVDYFYEGFLDKGPAFEKLISDSGLSPQQMLYIGDDIYDIPLLKAVGFSATVPEAVDEVKEVAHYITSRPGGMGAVREVCDLLLKHGG